MTTPACAWADLARADLFAMSAEIRAHHPGAIDVDNPGFLHWLDAGLTCAHDLAMRATDVAGYSAALRCYAAGFRDGHLGVSLPAVTVPRYWPGVHVEGRFGRVVVVQSDHEDIPVGAEIIAADGRPTHDLVSERVFAYWGNPAVEASFDRNVSRLLVDDGNPYTPPLSRILLADGEEIFERALTWRVQVPRAPIVRRAAWDQPRTGVHRLRLPSFNSNDTETVGSLRALNTWLRADLETVRRARAVVIDLRDNDGGSSGWADELFSALWGEAYYDACRSHAARSRVAWRASDANVAHVSAWLAPSSSLPASMHTWATRIAEGMQRARADGQDWFIEPGQPARALPLPPSPVSARVFVLQDGGASAGLDAMDRLKLIPDVTFIGRPTDADSQYMEVRAVALPSGHATLWLPIKVYRDRQRSAGEAYQPQISYSGLDRGDAALSAWALDLIDEMTAGSAP